MTGGVVLAPKVRDRLARPVVFIYWLMLGAGLGLYTYEVGSALPLWIGAIAGTVLGHCLALRDLRLWFVVAVIGGIVYLGVMLAPSPIAGPQLWLAFVPAVLCAYASLSDRWSLAAAWFPAVIWMLTILDRTQGTTQVDGFGAMLLGAVAIAFILFLRARESRRVGMWTRVAAQPLAATKAPAVLRDMPSLGFLRIGWTLGVTAITFAATAWLAPKMWKLESARHQEQVARAPIGAGYGGIGVPCCPLHDNVAVTRTRVREYLDLGRGREDRERELPSEPDCRVCAHGEGNGYAYGYGYNYGHGYYAPPVAMSTSTDGGGYGGGGVSTGGWDGSTSTFTDGHASGTAETYPTGQHITRDPYSDDSATTPRIAPPVVPPPAVPDVHALPQVPAQPAPVAPPPARDPKMPSTVPHVAVPPMPAVVTPPPPALSTPPAADPTAVPTRADPPPAPGSSLHWLVTLLAGGVIFQLVSLALRPLRRALTLRHLRSPLWAETVDQRVSNSWQLALVGLRDGGWRAGAGETPLELAKRVKLDDLATCATILERTRYGIQIDDGDLQAMQRAADATYHAARARVSGAARAVAWLRWPLA